MERHLINQLVLAARQCQQFGGEKYELQFEAFLNQLQELTRTSREEAVDLVVADLGG